MNTVVSWYVQSQQERETLSIKNLASKSFILKDKQNEQDHQIIKLTYQENKTRLKKFVPHFDIVM